MPLHVSQPRLHFTIDNPAARAGDSTHCGAPVGGVVSLAVASGVRCALGLVGQGAGNSQPGDIERGHRAPGYGALKGRKRAPSPSCRGLAVRSI
jgi:hypothetical protein